MDYEEITVYGKTYLIPSQLLPKDHKHRSPDRWVCLYYYKKNPHIVLPHQIETKDVITSKLSYRKGVFYKMSQLSNRDKHFDYFFKLKEDVPNVIVTETLRNSKKNPHLKNLQFNKEGKIVVNFN